MLFLLRVRVVKCAHLDVEIVLQRYFYSCCGRQSKIRVWRMQLEWANLLGGGKVESPRARRGCWRVGRGKECR